MQRRANRLTAKRRRGATIVEMAVVLPVFGIFMAGIMEVGHAYMVMQVLNSAAKQSARLGAVEGKTTLDVTTKAESIYSTAFDPGTATVHVKDGSDFDNPGFDASSVDYSALSDIELAEAEPQQLFIVRLEINYNDISLLPPMWITDITLTGMSVMRHE